MKMNFSDYRKRLNSCYLGKAVGGTLGMHNVDSMEKFCLQIEDTAKAVLEYYGSDIEMDFPSYTGEYGKMSPPWKKCRDMVSAEGMDRKRESTLSVLPYIVNIKYPEGTALRPGEKKSFSLRIAPVDFEAEKLSVSLSLPFGWTARHILNFI